MARRPRPARVDHRLTGGSRALLALAAVAVLLWLIADQDAHLALATAVVVAVVADLILARRAVTPVSVAIHGTDEVPAGEPASWLVQAVGWRRPVTLIPRLVPGDGEYLAVDGHTGRLSWPPMRRGIVPFVVVDVAASGPLGLALAARRHVVALSPPVAVTPAPIPVDLRWPRPRASGFGLVEGAPVGDDTFRSVRPYRPGDERRRVHWKATAHHGELMVRESEGTGVVTVRVVADLGPPGPAAEHTAGVTAWVAATALEQGWAVDLVTLDASQHAPMLATVGRPFGPRPVLAAPAAVPLPTITGPVRTSREVRRRLATAASGTPLVPGEGAKRLTCRVSQDGVTWS